MDILIVSPIPSHPPNQGNSARILALGRAMQCAGLRVHFLYHTMEGLTEAQHRAMASCWDELHIVPTDGREPMMTGGSVYRLDDWFAGSVAEAARTLHRRWRFAAVIVNYVWMSAVLEAFGADVVKIIDTHDIFGGRDGILGAAGLQPSWYFTSVAEEARGLARADIVLAIHADEARHFRALGHTGVSVIGHLAAQHLRHPRLRGAERLAVGYLASGNPLNLASFERLRARIAANGAAERYRFLLAGSICSRLPGSAAPFEALGFFDQVDTFYDSIDLVVNPMIGGTGLKIKSVEAVFQGMPLIATASAMVGLPVRHPLHSLPDPESLADLLRRHPFGEAELRALAVASRDCAALYAETVRAGLAELAAAITAPDQLKSARRASRKSRNTATRLELRSSSG